MLDTGNKLKYYLAPNGTEFIYTGQPNWILLNLNSNFDLIHSSENYSLKNSFPEIVYATYGTWFYLNTESNISPSISWHIDFNNFILKSHWKPILECIMNLNCSNTMKGLILGFSVLNAGGIPVFIKGIYDECKFNTENIISRDKLLFYNIFFPSKFFIYFKIRKYLFLNIFNSYDYSLYDKFRDLENSIENKFQIIKSRNTVSFIIPTMKRQHFVIQLLNDLSNQTLLPCEVIINDATPVSERVTDYSNLILPFPLKIIWQQSKGSCIARNECLRESTGEYIIFGDDDIRIPEDYIENHISFLSSTKYKACTGIDTSASHHTDGLDTLVSIRRNKSNNRSKIATHFTNANSCIHRSCLEFVPGNDINYDGGYGEDSDFGLSLIKAGIIVLSNPFSFTLHLKPPSGGYRWWGKSSALVGKKRKKQPWELDHPIGFILPAPSPTIMYFLYKHFLPYQIREYKIKYIGGYLFRGSKLRFILRFLNLPLKIYQMHISTVYAKRLVERGIRYE